MENYTCTICKRKFRKYASQVKYVKNVTCSRFCSGKLVSQRVGPLAANWRGGRKKMKCMVCGSTYTVIPAASYRRKCCSKKCKHVLMRKTYIPGREKDYGSGIRVGNGYIYIKAPDHPKADINGYYKEHRLVMEKKLGRFLRKNEIIHHINYNKQDNRIENLMLFKSHSAHAKYHFKEGSHRKLSRRPSNSV